MSGETIISKAISDALAFDPAVRLWRNNCGVVRKGGRFIRFGLCVGSSDLIGLIASRFAALEVKAPKGSVTTEEQHQFIADVRALGGFACIVHSVDEARAAVARAKTGAVE